MEITDIRIRRLEGSNKMKAIVSITIDDEFVLHDIKVVDGEKGLFIAMPSKKTADGEYRDIAHDSGSVSAGAGTGRGTMMKAIQSGVVVRQPLNFVQN